MSDMLNGETVLYPIIGDPIVFVKSPQKLSEAFAVRNHNGICVPMQVAEGDLKNVMAGLGLVPNVRGILVTMPHKTAIYESCSTVSQRSEQLGVINVMRRNGDGSWHGDMLDGIAFVAAQKAKGAKLGGATVLQIGVGGAGSAIAIELLNAGVRKLVLHDLDERRAAALITLLSSLNLGEVTAGPPDPRGFDIVVNATPLGMGENDPLPVPATRLSGSMFVGDVVAGQGVTPLLRAAQAIGCKTADGIGMVRANMECIVRFLLDH